MVPEIAKKENVLEKKNEKSKLVALAPNNPPKELKAIFDPPTELPIKCFLEGQRSFIEDRRWEQDAVTFNF